MSPSYKVNDPKGWGGDPKRGAAMGRPSVVGDPNFSGTLYVREVLLTDGYDRNGTYFGSGPPTLYWVASYNNSIDRCFRALGNSGAIIKATELYPKAKIKFRATRH